MKRAAAFLLILFVGLTSFLLSHQSDRGFTSLTGLTTLSPSVSNLLLNSTLGTNLTDENLTIYYNASDPEGDNITNITDWRVNSSSIAILNMPFENYSGAGSTTIDYSTWGNNGTVFGAHMNATGDHDGSGGYLFNGSGDYINVSTLHVVSGINDSFTIEAWVYPISTGIIVKKSVASQDQDGDFILVADAPSGKIGFALFANGGWYPGFIQSGGGPSLLNAWHHIAVTHNATGKLTFYVDGLNASIFSGITYTEGGNHTVSIGQSQTGISLQSFNGTIGYVRIYNRTLSAEQIQILNMTRNSVMSSQETMIGDNWTAVITPNDGTSDGTSVTSNTVRIVEDRDADSFNHLFDCNDGDASIIPPSTNYFLNRSVQFCPGIFNLPRGVKTNVSNISITCNSTTLNATSNAFDGIDVLGGNNVTVQNCVIVGFSDGILLNPSNNSLIVNNNISSSTNAGVDLSFSHNNTLFNNTIFNIANAGIIVSTSNKNNITGNNLYNSSSDGIFVQGNVGLGQTSTNNTFFSNNLSYNGFAGMQLTASSIENSVVNNFFSNNSDTGIYITTSSTLNLITNNTLLNHVHDIFTTGSSLQNTLVIFTDKNKLLFDNLFVNVSHMSNIFVNKSIVSVNSSAEQNMNTTANVSFSVISCGVQLFESPSFNTVLQSAITNAVACTKCSNMICANNVTNFTTSSFSTIFANYVPNITAVFPNATGAYQNISGTDTNISLSFNVNSTRTFNVSAVDLDSSMLTYRWYVGETLKFSENVSNTSTSQFSHTFDTVGSHTVTVVVNDSVSNDTFSFINNVNALPSAVSVSRGTHISTFAPCSAEFVCGDWSVCNNGTQIRTCTDAKRCYKPKNETQQCTIAPVPEKPAARLPSAPTPEVKPIEVKSNAFVIAMMLLVLLSIVLVLTLVEKLRSPTFRHRRDRDLIVTRDIIRKARTIEKKDRHMAEHLYHDALLAFDSLSSEKKLLLEKDIYALKSEVTPVYGSEYDVLATKKIIEKVKSAIKKDSKIAATLYNNAIRAYEFLSKEKKKLFEDELNQLRKLLP